MKAWKLSKQNKLFEEQELILGCRLPDGVDHSDQCCETPSTILLFFTDGGSVGKDEMMATEDEHILKLKFENDF